MRDKVIPQNDRYREKITRILKSINPDDPIKYDFALSRPPLLGICLSRWDYSHCIVCPLREICLIGRSIHSYSKLFYTQLKDIVKGLKPSRALQIHNLVVKKLLEYLVKIGYRECKVDYAIDHCLRPDLYCFNSGQVIGEVKISSETRQGPIQLRVYAEELVRQNKLKERAYGVVAYWKTHYSDIPFIREAIELLKLDRYYNQVTMLGFDKTRSTFKEISII